VDRLQRNIAELEAAQTQKENLEGEIERLRSQMQLNIEERGTTLNQSTVDFPTTEVRTAGLYTQTVNIPAYLIISGLQRAEDASKTPTDLIDAYFERTGVNLVSPTLVSFTE